MKTNCFKNWISCITVNVSYVKLCFLVGLQRYIHFWLIIVNRYSLTTGGVILFLRGTTCKRIKLFSNFQKIIFAFQVTHENILI